MLYFFYYGYMNIVSYQIESKNEECLIDFTMNLIDELSISLVCIGVDKDLFYIFY